VSRPSLVPVSPVLSEKVAQNLIVSSSIPILSHQSTLKHMGLSENSVPQNPMVLLIIIPTKWLFHWGYTPFSDIPT
jgi:hypothetical protein